MKTRDEVEQLKAQWRQKFIDMPVDETIYRALDNQGDPSVAMMYAEIAQAKALASIAAYLQRIVNHMDAAEERNEVRDNVKLWDITP